MRLRIVLGLVLTLVIGTGATFQQLNLTRHQRSASTAETTSTVANLSPSTSTTSPPLTTTSGGHTTSTLATHVINPPVVTGVSTHFSTNCPLFAPIETTTPTTTPLVTTTTDQATTTTSEPTSTTSTSTPSSTTTTSPPGSKSCTVLEVGDSIGWGRGFDLTRDLAQNKWIHFYMDDRGSTGLSNQNYFNWIEQIQKDLDQYHPSLLMVSFGGNDAQGISGKGIGEYFGTPRWRSLYASRVNQILTMAAEHHCGILWLGMPVSGSGIYNQRQLIINQIYAHAVANATNAAFIPLWNVLSRNGLFTPTARVNGNLVTVRSPDRIHPSGWGYAVEATYIINQMKSLYRVDLILSGRAYITGF